MLYELSGYLMLYDFACYCFLDFMDARPEVMSILNYQAAVRDSRLIYISAWLKWRECASGKLSSQEHAFQKNRG